MTIDNDKIQEVADAAQKFKDEFNHEFLEVKEVFYDYMPDDEGDLPQYQTHVVVQDKKRDSDDMYGRTYTYPVRDFGVERGLYLFDTVTDWNDRTVTLRFGIANE
jgi:hypothetical protein